MRILIWKSYGEVDAQCAETVQHLERICLDVIEIVKDWHMEDFDDLKRHFDEVMSTHRLNGEEKTRGALVRLIKDWVDNNCGDTESFEQFYFSRVKY